MIYNTVENKQAREILFNSLVEKDLTCVKNWILELEEENQTLKDKLHRRNQIIENLRGEIKELKNELEHTQIFGNQL